MYQVSDVSYYVVRNDRLDTKCMEPAAALHSAGLLSGTPVHILSLLVTIIL